MEFWQKYGHNIVKWGLTGLIGLVLFNLFSPLLIATATGAFTLLSLGVNIGHALLQLGIIAFVIVAGVMFLPVAMEMIANIADNALASEIERNPIPHLRRQQDANLKRVDDLERSAAEMEGAVRDSRSYLSAHKQNMLPEQVASRQQQIEELSGLAKVSREVVRDEVVKHKEFERVVAAAEGDFAVGQSIGKAANKFKMFQKAGPKSEGTRIALQQVQHGLNESSSRLSLALDRKVAELNATNAANATKQPLFLTEGEKT